MTKKVVKMTISRTKSYEKMTPKEKMEYKSMVTDEIKRIAEELGVTEGYDEGYRIVPAIMVQYDLTKEPERWDEAMVRSLLKLSGDRYYEICSLKSELLNKDKQIEQSQYSLMNNYREAQKLTREYHTLNIAKSFALVAFGMTLGAIIWMWL